MLKTSSICLETVVILVLGIAMARPQGAPTGGWYQIVSGRYTACCGIAGSTSDPLPNASDTFVELTVDRQKNLAQMRFLGADMQTVLRIPPQLSRSEFVYAFTNGMVFADHIQFGDPFLPPVPDQASFSFVISNSMDTLLINGTVITPCPGCADVPQEFQHTNVVAVGMPTPAIRVSEVEVCWNSTSNRTYQVQYRSTLTTNSWVDLGPPVVANSSNSCITDKVLLGQPQRYYHVLILP
jgi:hypothetical protein